MGVAQVVDVDVAGDGGGGDGGGPGVSSEVVAGEVVGGVPASGRAPGFQVQAVTPALCPVLGHGSPAPPAFAAAGGVTGRRAVGVGPAMGVGCGPSQVGGE